MKVALVRSISLCLALLGYSAQAKSCTPYGTSCYNPDDPDKPLTCCQLKDSPDIVVECEDFGSGFQVCQRCAQVGEKCRDPYDSVPILCCGNLECKKSNPRKAGVCVDASPCARAGEKCSRTGARGIHCCGSEDLTCKTRWFTKHGKCVKNDSRSGNKTHHHKQQKHQDNKKRHHKKRHHKKGNHH